MPASGSGKRTTIPWDRSYAPTVELVEVVLYVRDMDTSIRFYRDILGLAVGDQSPGWTTFRTGACVLALHAVERRELGTAEPDPTFLVDDATVERNRLLGAGVEVSEIREPVAGTRVFDARDPDGNRFSLEARTWGDVAGPAGEMSRPPP